MNSLSEIRAIFDSDIDQSVARFQTKLDSLVNPIISQIQAVPYEPITATDVFDKVTVAFSLGIGDSTSGIYGDFVVDLSAAVEKCSQSINRYVSNSMITSQQQLDAIQGEITSLSSHISSYSTEATTKVGNLITSASTKFSSALTVAQTKASEYFINYLTDSYLGAIARADKHAQESIDRLKSIYASYKTLPSSFYSDVNNILTEISDTYNDAIDKANISYNDSISSYKYWSSSAENLIVSSQASISSALTSSNVKISALFTSLSSDLYNKADYAFAVAITVLSSKMFTESIRIRNNLNNLVSSLSERANGTIKIIDRYFKDAYHPIYVDGSDYRNGKATVINGASQLLSDEVNSIINEYNTKTDVISSNYSSFLESLQADVISYINNNVPGLTEEQLATIESKLSTAINKYNDRISNYFTVYSTKLSTVSDGLSSYLTRVTDKYYTKPPLLRYTGASTAPASITKTLSYVDDKDTDDTSDDVTVYNNKFTFDVINIGLTAWQGWFGIRLTSSVDYDTYAANYLEETGDTYTGDYEVPYFKWNKRLGLESLLPGQTKSFSIIVPGSLIYNLDELGDNVIPTIIVNTVGGISSLLLSN